MRGFGWLRTDLERPRAAGWTALAYADRAIERTGLMCVFFFQAEDGIRDLTVTGVQTCALPIFMIVARTASVRIVYTDAVRATIMTFCSTILAEKSAIRFVSLPVRNLVGSNWKDRKSVV